MGRQRDLDLWEHKHNVCFTHTFASVAQATAAYSGGSGAASTKRLKLKDCESGDEESELRVGAILCSFLGFGLVADPDTDPGFGFCLAQHDEDAHGRRAHLLLPTKQFHLKKPQIAVFHIFSWSS